MTNYKCKYAKKAYETGYSDALFDGFRSTIPWKCRDSAESYYVGWNVGLDELDEEMAEVTEQIGEEESEGNPCAPG